MTIVKRLCFYKYRYWLLSSVATGDMNEEEKNNMFCRKFFNTQNVKIGSNVYKIRQLHNEGDYYFGQIGRETTAQINEDTGVRIDPVETDDNPFLYYLSIARAGYQIIYVQRDSRNVLGTTTYSIERKLTQIAGFAVSPLIARVNCIVDESDFWDSIRYFKIIDKLEFTFTRPNFLECEESLSKVLNKLKGNLNSDELNIGYKGHNGLKIAEDNEEIKAQAKYSSEYSGNWKIKGRRSENSTQETRSKTNVFEAIQVELSKGVEDIKSKFQKIKQQIYEKSSN